MRYIENLELREWVKDSLRKAIFQKAHALAVQTGCEILVKLQDVSAPTKDQFYATHTLHKAYNSNALRKQPGEKFVSGETGMPLVDQAVQSDDFSTQGVMTGSDVCEGGDFMGESFADQSILALQGMPSQQESAVPMQLVHATTTTTPTSESRTDMSMSASDLTPSQFEAVQSESNDADIQIKIEPGGDLGIMSEECMQGTDTKQFEVSPHQQQMGVTERLFGQAPSMVGQSSTPMKYPVPISPKPYQCGVCQKAFRSLQVLQKHTQTFHTKHTHHQKLTPRSRGGRGRGRGHFTYRPTQSQTSFVFSGGNGNQQTMSTQNFPGTSSSSSQEIAASSSSQFAQHPSATPVTLDPSTSSADFNPSGPGTFQFPNPGTSSSPSAVQQGQSPGRNAMPPFSSSQVESKFTPPESKLTHSISDYTITRSILLSKGPITTQQTLRNNFKKLRNVTKEEFLAASNRLEMCNLGSVVDVSGKVGGSNRRKPIFVKRLPAEVQSLLEMEGSLCTPEEYVNRFYMRVPGIISLQLRAELVNLGLVSENLLK